MHTADAAPVSSQAISRFTILLLSGVIVSMAGAGYLDQEVVKTLLGCGLTGIFAFLGCEAAAIRKGQRDERRLRQRMEKRMARHLTRDRAPSVQLLSHAELERALRAIRLGDE